LLVWMTPWLPREPRCRAHSDNRGQIARRSCSGKAVGTTTESPARVRWSITDARRDLHARRLLVSGAGHDDHDQRVQADFRPAHAATLAEFAELADADSKPA